MTAVVVALVVVATMLGIAATIWLIWPAGVIAALFLVLYLVRRGQPDTRDENVFKVAAASSWILYGVWEGLLRFGPLCDDECNIRVDLLLILPLLIGISSMAVAKQMRAWRRARQSQVAT